jgi:hypothetical protein
VSYSINPAGGPTSSLASTYSAAPRAKRKYGGILAAVSVRVLLSLIVCVIVIAVTGCGDGNRAATSAAGDTTPKDKPGPHAGAGFEATVSPAGGKGRVGSPYPPMEHVELPKMLSDDDCTFVSTEVFIPVNGWRVGDRRTSTIVCAGGAGVGEARSKGEFVILRTNDTRGTQGMNAVYVHGSGPIKITRAPMGPKVVTSAQHGDLEFTSAKGITGTLHLGDDTVTLNR